MNPTSAVPPLGDRDELAQMLASQHARGDMEMQQQLFVYLRAEMTRYAEDNSWPELAPNYFGKAAARQRVREVQKAGQEHNDRDVAATDELAQLGLTTVQRSDNWDSLKDLRRRYRREVPKATQEVIDLVIRDNNREAIAGLLGRTLAYVRYTEDTFKRAYWPRLASHLTGRTK